MEGMFNQKNHFILEYTNLLTCHTCMFPLVAVAPQSYLVLIRKYNYTLSYRKSKFVETSICIPEDVISLFSSVFPS